MPSFTTIVAAFIGATASAWALAVPADAVGPSNGVDAANDNSCGKGAKPSCCDTASGDAGFLGVLGGSCFITNPTSMGGGNSNCGNDGIYCCPTTQTGEINVNLACVPLSA